MKKYALFLFLISVVIGCVDENDVSMDFKITGANNKTLVRGTGFTMGLSVYYLGGDKTDVTISALSVPQGISLTIDQPTGEPDFSCSATITTDASLTPGNYTVVLQVESDQGKKIERSFVLTITDPMNQLPVITIAGPAIVPQTLNVPFTDPGFMASDPEDGDLTAQVIVTGSVNHDLTGNYVLTYKVFDSDGDSAVRQRTVQVTNSNAYMQGLYNCTTVIQNGITFTWNAYIATSTTVNYNFVLNKISDCFGSLTDPMQLEVIPWGPGNLTIPPQVVYGINTTQPLHCDEAYHNIAGGGTVTYTMPYTFTLIYTDLYEDSTGLQHTYSKTDTYVKVP